MPRPPKPPSFVARHKRAIVALLLVLAVLSFIPATYGLAGVFFIAALGVGAMAGGSPSATEDGSNRISVPGSWRT